MSGIDLIRDDSGNLIKVKISNTIASTEVIIKFQNFFFFFLSDFELKINIIKKERIKI